MWLACAANKPSRQPRQPWPLAPRPILAGASRISDQPTSESQDLDPWLESLCRARIQPPNCHILPNRFSHPHIYISSSTFAMAKKQKVLVIGAGPVGSLAALYAANRGDDVEIYELRSGELFPVTLESRNPRLILPNNGIDLGQICEIPRRRRSILPNQSTWPSQSAASTPCAMLANQNSSTMSLAPPSRCTAA